MVEFSYLDSPREACAVSALDMMATAQHWPQAVNIVVCSPLPFFLFFSSFFLFTFLLLCNTLPALPSSPPHNHPHTVTPVYHERRRVWSRASRKRSHARGHVLTSDGHVGGVT
eukprot:1899735-Rhodomonas_salina.1